MNKTFDVVVVGAGYIGCATAYYLSKAGLKTALVERGEVAAGASRANYGNIQVQDAELEYSLLMILRGYQECLRIEEELGCPVKLRKLGSLLVIENPKQWEIMSARQKKLAAAGIHAELVPSEHLREIEPMINPSETIGALYHPDEAQIFPFDLMWAYIRRARTFGLALLTNTEVIDFQIRSGRLTGIHTTQGEISTGNVILTTGAWTRKLGEKIEKDWAIYHVHGQSLVTEPLQYTFQNHFSSAAFFEDICEETPAGESAVLAIAQAWHGNMLLGEASFPSEDLASHATPGAPQVIAEQFERFFPKFKNLRVLRGWASPVAYTPDSLPYFGPVADLPGLILAAAFRSTVIVTPLTGQTITQMITTGKTDLDISHFSPDRKVVS